MNEKTLISIIIPVFNEKESIPLLYKRLRNVIDSLNKKYEFEILFTNNCSTDSTLETIQKLRTEDPRIEVITFSRNFGHEVSIRAGIEHANGSLLITMDGDGEDPPELIKEFVKYWENGYEIVYGERSPGNLKFFRKLFYRITSLIADHDFILDMADFNLITSDVRDVIIQNRSTYPFTRTDVAYAGFKRKAIPYQRQNRLAGINTGSSSILKMAMYAMGGILSSSTFPLRLAAYIGFPLIIVDIILLMYRDLFVLVLINSVYVILFIIFISIYLARVYNDIMHRPMYIIDWRHSSIEQ